MSEIIFSCDFEPKDTAELSKSFQQVDITLNEGSQGVCFDKEKALRFAAEIVRLANMIYD